jgi:hypothetical protein
VIQAPVLGRLEKEKGQSFVARHVPNRKRRDILSRKALARDHRRHQVPYWVVEEAAFLMNGEPHSPMTVARRHLNHRQYLMVVVLHFLVVQIQRHLNHPEDLMKAVLLFLVLV